MKTVRRIAPILPVADVGVALAHYERLGFSARAYAGGGYGFLLYDGHEIHLGEVPAEEAGSGSAYVFVVDADAVAARWAETGADVRPPQDTEWGMREGVLVDLDGNRLRFGSPLGE